MRFWKPDKQALQSLQFAQDDGDARRSLWPVFPVRGAAARSVMSFFVVVVLPTLAYLIWLTAVATPRFTSEFRVLVRAPHEAQGVDLPQIIGLSSPLQSSQDAYAVIQYLKSQQAADDLDAVANLRKRYGSETIDHWSRLSPGASNAALARYWRRRLDAYYENTTSTIVVRVTAFSPQDADELATAALRLSERLVNDMSGRARTDLVQYASRDLEKASQNLRSIEQRMLRLRNEKGLIDPAAAAAANQARQVDVQRAITETRADISTKSAYLSSDSPIIQLLRRRLRSLEAELGAVQRESTTHGGDEKVLSTSVSAFEQVEADQAFAQKSYQAAAAALTAARSEQVRQQLYLDTIVAPTLPDEATFPRPGRQSILAFALLCGLWTMGFLLVRSAKSRL